MSFFKKKAGNQIYHFADENGMNQQVSTKNHKIVLEKAQKVAFLKITTKELRYKNKFYEVLFFLGHKNGEILTSDYQFELPNNWRLEKIKN